MVSSEIIRQRVMIYRDVLSELMNYLYEGEELPNLRMDVLLISSIETVECYKKCYDLFCDEVNVSDSEKVKMLENLVLNYMRRDLFEEGI